MTSTLMFDRRSFLVASAAVTAGSYLEARPLTGLAIPPSLFVLDRKFESVLRATDTAAKFVSINGDVTALWRDHLSTLWRTSPARVDGLTGASALFCLEQLARGAGHDVALRQPLAGTDAIRWSISPVSLKGFT